ncbi:MAG: TAXI family TRAP transporter solute-binding subunit [Gammaproteobacteria bacterium]|nr:TAXI family TRAP transporter solute-binding subunit [Gammaproteobacteria bacterium]
MKTRKLIWSLVAACAVALTGAAGLSVAQEMKFFKIASGSAGGTYFPIAGIIANAVSNPPGSRPCEKRGSCGVPGLVAIAMSANGSVANVNSIESGAVESGFVQSDVTYWAYTGTGVFEGKPPMKKLRALANLYPEHIHVVVRADSPFKAVEDLRGKRIGIGLQASGAKVGAVLILEAHGMKENVDYQAEYLNSQQSIDRIRDGQLEAMITVTGYPQAAIVELASTVGARLLPIAPDKAAIVKKQAPFYYSAVIPARVYEGVLDDTPTVAVGAQWLVSSEVDADLVYGITKALWNDNSRKLLDNGHAKGDDIRIETALDAISIPLHSGAARYYKEVGMKLPESQ